MTVAELLEQSRAAHNRYREALPQRIDGRIVGGDRPAQIAALTEARDTRAEAATLDPSFSDPAWSEANHADLMAFYADQLSR